MDEADIREVHSGASSSSGAQTCSPPARNWTALVPRAGRSASLRALTSSASNPHPSPFALCCAARPPPCVEPPRPLHPFAPAIVAIPVLAGPPAGFSSTSRAYLHCAQTLGSCRRERSGPGRELPSGLHHTTTPHRQPAAPSESAGSSSSLATRSMLSRPPSISRASPPPARSSRHRR